MWNARLHKCFVWEHAQKEALCGRPGKTDLDTGCGVVKAEIIAGKSRNPQGFLRRNLTDLHTMEPLLREEHLGDSTRSKNKQDRWG